MKTKYQGSHLLVITYLVTDLEINILEVFHYLMLGRQSPRALLREGTFVSWMYFHFQTLSFPKHHLGVEWRASFPPSSLASFPGLKALMLVSGSSVSLLAESGKTLPMLSTCRCSSRSLRQKDRVCASVFSYPLASICHSGSWGWV